MLAKLFPLFGCTSGELYISLSKWYGLLVGIVILEKCIMSLSRMTNIRLIYQNSCSYSEYASVCLMFIFGAGLRGTCIKPQQKTV